MVIYPHSNPIILNDTIYSQFGGLGTGSFSSQQLQYAYWLAEMEVTSYICAPLLPTNMTGTYTYQGHRLIPTDYGYVQQLYSVNVLTQQGCSTCDLQSNAGCGYIWSDTFGYIDFRQVASVCGCAYWSFPFSPYVAYGYPYQIVISYQAGLPTGTANQPGILRALTIQAQIALNDEFPGVVGINESQGNIGIQEFRSLDYFEKRAEHALVKSNLGGSAMSQRAKSLIDMSIRKARRVLFA